MGNVFRHELRANYKGMLIWALSLAAAAYLFMYLFPSIASEHAKWDALISQLPRGILSGFGMDQLRISTIFGYYGTQVYSVLVLFVAIYGVMLFSGLLAREEGEGTIEFLLARPISRGDIFWGKALAAVGLAIACNALLFLGTWAAFAQFHTKPYALGLLAWFAVGLLLLTLVFGFLGLLAAVYLPRPKTLTPLTIGVAFASYVCGIAAGMSTKLADLRFVSPFRFVDQTLIVRHAAVPAADWLGLLAVCALAAAWAYAYYRAKDITA